MALNNLGMGFIFSARDMATPTIQGLQKNFRGLSNTTDAAAARMTASMGMIKSGMVLAAAGGIALGGAISMANAAGIFEQNMAAVAKISGATQEELKGLENAAIEAGIATQFSPAEAVEGLQSLTAAGQNAGRAIQTLNPVLDLAAGSLGQLGVAGAAQVTVGVLNAFGMAAEESGRRVDQLLRVTQLTNYQAADFGVTLGQVAAQANISGQSFEETIATLGVLRNAAVPASVAATSLREAYRRLTTDAGALKRMQELGISPMDKTTGKMRIMSDIVGDLIPKLSGMNDIQKGQILMQMFGTKGLAAYNAIAQSTYEKTMPNGTKVMLKGIAAFKAMKEEIVGATNTAKEFREALLDTYEGQKTLLSGTLKTAAIVFGQSFTMIFKPIVRVVTDAINAVIKIWRTLPGGLKKGVAMLITLFGVVATGVGTLLLFKGMLGLLGLTLGSIIASMAAAVVALWPLYLALGVGILLFKTFSLALEKDIGGIGTFFKNAWSKVSLFFRALTEVFSKGAFSEAVYTELNKAENQGIKAFVINLYVWGGRIGAFFKWMGEGISSALEAAKPTFLVLQEALRGLGEALGFTSRVAGAGENLKAWQAFADAGAVVGRVIGTLIEILVSMLIPIIRIVTGLIKGFKSAWVVLGPTMNMIKNVFMETFAILGDLFIQLGFVSSAVGDSGGIWEILGRVVGFVLGAIASSILYFVSIIQMFTNVAMVGIKIVIGLFKDLAGWVEGVVFVIGGILTGDWAAAWMGAKKMVFSFVNGIIRVLMGLHEGVSGIVDGIASLFGKDLGAAKAARKMRADLEMELAKKLGIEVGLEGGGVPGLRAAPVTAERKLATVVRRKEEEISAKEESWSRSRLDFAVASGMYEAADIHEREQGITVTELGAGGGITDEQFDKLMAAMDSRPINLQVEIDGEKVAQSVTNANRELAGRGFVPTAA